MAAIMDYTPTRHRITVDEYYRMAEVGLLAPDARVELIEGEIIDMAPIGDPHMAAVDWLTERFIQSLASRAIVRTQGVIQLGERSMPQPDLVLLRPRSDFYSNKRAVTTDALLVIEVSDTTLRYDLGTKVPLYARHGIPEVWVYNVDGTLHTYHGPAAGQYVHASVTRDPGVKHLWTLPDIHLDLTGMNSLYAPAPTALTSGP